MKTRFSAIFLPLMFIPFIGSSQNKVGIGTTNPSEKLEVNGIIYSNQGGIRFPDQTLQETAAYNGEGAQYAAMPKLQPYMLIVTTNPTLPDTIFLLDLNQGGITASLSLGMPGPVAPDPFRFVKELDKATPNLVKKLALNTVLTTATIEFPQAPPAESPYETIELRNAQLTSIAYQAAYRSDGTWAHYEIIEMVYQKIEIRYLVGPDVCYCWDFVMNTNCTCN